MLPCLLTIIRGMTTGSSTGTESGSYTMHRHIHSGKATRPRAPAVRMSSHGDAVAEQRAASGARWEMTRYTHLTLRAWHGSCSR